MLIVIVTRIFDHTIAPFLKHKNEMQRKLEEEEEETERHGKGEAGHKIVVSPIILDRNLTSNSKNLHHPQDQKTVDPFASFDHGGAQEVKLFYKNASEIKLQHSAL